MTAPGMCSAKKLLLIFFQNSQDNTWVKVYFLIGLQPVGLQHCWKETPAEKFSSKFRKMYQNTFLIAPLQMAAFE